MSVWELAYEDYDSGDERLREALCTVGNGFFATRGAAPEADADDVHYPGTYAGGLFNRRTSHIADEAIENEDLVNLPNWLPLTFRVDDGEWFHIDAVDVLDHRQSLDLRGGVLVRHVRFADEAGRVTRVDQRRFVSMADEHLAGLATTITPENWSGRLTVRAGLDGSVRNGLVARYQQLANDHLEPIEADAVGEDRIWLQVRTSQSRVEVAEAARTRVLRGGAVVDTERQVEVGTDRVSDDRSLRVEQGQSVTVEKLASLFTSRDSAIAECGHEARRLLLYAGDLEDRLAEHRDAWERLWRRCRLATSGSERTQLITNLHVFHLLVTVSEHTIDRDVGVPARGLHGEAYRGHIFWDELFIFPFLTLHLPELTRALLLYRYRRLPEARRTATVAGHRGAMYPWQSGSNGREESQRIHLNPKSGRWIPDNSHLQRHINIAIAYNVWQYYEVTDDVEFLAFAGAEMMLEIARFLASLTEYDSTRKRYVIRGVIGPDEYHDGYPDSEQPGLNNNAYTNVMAVWVLSRALDALNRLPADRATHLREQLDVSDDELSHWQELVRAMFVPFHPVDPEEGRAGTERSHVISQFEGYENLEEFDWAGYKQRYGDIQRLDRILEAEDDTPNRYKASKQADVVMLFYLLSHGELEEIFSGLGYPFDAELMTTTVDYYLARTSHGSTLSRVVHSWVLARLDRTMAWQFFLDALESDVADIQGGTTREGIHLGAMAGTVDLIQRCFTGLDTTEDVLWFDPVMPDELDELSFEIRYRQHWSLSCRLDHHQLEVTASPNVDSPVSLGVKGEVHELAPGTTRAFPL